MMIRKFNVSELSKLYKSERDSNGEDNGQVTIIGGSSLFHGAPILALKVASRIVDMVFFATPEKSVGKVAEKVKSKLSSFIWVPWEDAQDYVSKSDAILIGPGFMRFGSEKTPGEERTVKCDGECQKTKEITKKFLTNFPNKKWVIDAGSLQVLDPGWIPSGAILTPNKKEYKIVFGDLDPSIAAKRYNCIIVVKGPITNVYSSEDVIEVNGGNPGLTKGGTGDIQAGLTLAFLAKNEPLLSACAASYLIKSVADKLYEKVSTNYNADDLADFLPETLTDFPSEF